MRESEVCGRKRRSEFSLAFSRSCEGAKSGRVCDQAREKGWAVWRPMEGMVRKMCWPG